MTIRTGEVIKYFNSLVFVAAAGSSTGLHVVAAFNEATSIPFYVALCLVGAAGFLIGKLFIEQENKLQRDIGCTTTVFGLFVLLGQQSSWSLQDLCIFFFVMSIVVGFFPRKAVHNGTVTTTHLGLDWFIFGHAIGACIGSNLGNLLRWLSA